MRSLLPLLVLLAGCRQDPPLDRFEILRVIQNERGFQQPLLVSAPRVSGSDCERATAKGWAKLLAARVIELSPVRSGCEASLSQEARQILGLPVTRTQLPPDIEIPVARRNIVSIDRQDPLGGGAEIQFTWSWDPNEIGKRLAVSTKLMRGKAELQLVREIWTAVRVDAGGTEDPLQ